MTPGAAPLPPAPRGPDPDCGPAELPRSVAWWWDTRGPGESPRFSSFCFTGDHRWRDGQAPTERGRITKAPRWGGWVVHSHPCVFAKPRVRRENEGGKPPSCPAPRSPGLFSHAAARLAAPDTGDIPGLRAPAAGGVWTEPAARNEGCGGGSRGAGALPGGLGGATGARNRRL